MKPELVGLVPVNKQAKMFLSKGTGQLETLEQALAKCGNIIGESHCEQNRFDCDKGLDVTYVVKIMKLQGKIGYEVYLTRRTTKKHGITGYRRLV